MDNGLGARVRAFRKWRGMTLRSCAELAGMGKTTLADFETGRRQLDRKSHIDALAAALRVSPTELIGQPYGPAPGDPQRSRAQAGVDGIRAALMETEMGALPEPDQPLADLVTAAYTVEACNSGADIATTTRLLPGVLTGLAVYAGTAPEEQQHEALGALTRARANATSVLIALGYRDLAWIAAAQARQAAKQLGEPAYVGRADFAMIRATAPYSRRGRYSEQAVAQLQPHAGGDDTAGQVYGMLHLMAAYDAAVVGGDVDGHLAEAQAMAGKLGEGNAFHLCFGPTNITLFKIAIAVEKGEGGRVNEFGQIDKKAVSRERLGNYHRDMFRAHVQAGRDAEALPHLMEAERLYPEELRNNALARQATADMLRRARRVVTGSPLHSVAHRMGIS